MCQQELQQIYAEHLPNLANWVHNCDVANLSYPLLIDIGAHCYQAASTKLMIVGQQTNGWGPPPGFWDGTFPGGNVHQFVLDRCQDYANFHLGQGYASAFWLCAHYVYHRRHSYLNRYGPLDGFLWSNLLKVDQGGNQPDAATSQALLGHFNLLPREIALAKPDAIVFFTGPNYDDILTQVFPNAEINETPYQGLARVVHQELPEASYRIYHPIYILMQGGNLGNPHVLNRLVELIANDVGGGNFWARLRALFCPY